MSPGTVALLVAGGLAATGLGWRRRTLDDHHPPARPAGLPAVSVVVPARDEERALPRLLASLARQHPPPAEVLVVDDGSTDATAAVARAAGATVVTAPPPPPGWAGKPWACHLGVEQATAPLVVLLDADTWLAPDAVARLLAAHEALSPDGLLSVQPHHHVARPHEQLSLLCNIVPVLASAMWSPRGPRRRSPAAVAFGPCLVTRREDLVAAGGFAGVRGEVLEDVALARAYARAGRPVACLGGGATVAFRMYPDGLRSLVEGWTKNLAGGARHTPLVPTFGAVLWVAALAALSVEALWRPSAAVAVAWVLASAQLWWLGRRVGTFHPASAVMFPVPLWAFVGLFLRSVVHRSVRRRVRWRGRELPVAPR